MQQNENASNPNFNTNLDLNMNPNPMETGAANSNSNSNSTGTTNPGSIPNASLTSVNPAAAALHANTSSRPTTPGEMSTDNLLAAPTSKSNKQKHEPAAEAVISYLRKRGLGSALLELQRHLDEDEKQKGKEKEGKNFNSGIGMSGDGKNSKRSKTQDHDEKDASTSASAKQSLGDGTPGVTTPTAMEEDDDDITELERLEEKYKDQESALTLMTGGGAGYDLDAAPAILSWINGPASNLDSEHDGTGMNMGTKNHTQTTSSESGKIHIRYSDAQGPSQPEELEDIPAETESKRNRQLEAKRCIRAFTALQTWVLSLPDGEGEGASGLSLQDLKNRINRNRNSNGNDNDNRIDSVDGAESTNQGVPTTTTKGSSKSASANATANSNAIQSASFIPPSIKPELLSLTFPLLVHTYCDLLESNLEQSASLLLSTYRYIHEPRYPTEFRDLDRCHTSAGIAKLNDIVVSANEALNKAKTIRLSYDKRKNAVKNAAPGSSPNPKVMEEIEILQKQYELVVNSHTTLLRHLKDYPFLKRVRSVKWQLNLSSVTFGYLARFLRSSDMLLPMSVLLQTRCQVLVESRDPSPFIPACILEDMILPPTNVDASSNTKTDEKNGEKTKDSEPSNDASDVKWAAPVHPSTRSNELGELESSILKDPQDLPFPKFYLEKEYNTASDYEKDKQRVEFNRALLSHGFRRLAALETKDEYEVGMRRMDGGEERKAVEEFGNPLEPSIMLSTLCSSFEGSRIKDPASPLEESGIELTCAKMCPPDGRRVATGCSDSAVRIWSMDSWSSLTGKGSVDSITGASSKESVIVLVGHKRGLPVFDVDWNRDGRTLISAGGDGSLRLWDTKAVGSYGEITRTITRKPPTNGSKSTLQMSIGGPNTDVPGSKMESTAQRHGSALVCYQGHAPSRPVWSVSIAPCGYYFASAGADSTARLWCTDRTMPVRVFTGHFSENVNCVSFHPNCNYIMTGSDDKTVRMWDVQSGNCVRMLSGCGAGVNKVEVSPSGQFVAGADYRGIVHIWDLRNGRKLNEFKNPSDAHAHTAGLSHGHPRKVSQPPIIQSMSFSPCGNAIATSSDDSNIHIWNTQGLGNHASNPEFAALTKQGQGGALSNLGGKASDVPFHTFATNRTSILDLRYTKRNLLLSVGKYFKQ